MFNAIMPPIMPLSFISMHVAAMIAVVATIVTSKECNQNCPPLTNISHIGKIDPPHLHLLQIQDATNCWEQHSQDRPNLPSEAANTA